MTTCKHNTSTAQADHGNVNLSECDWCGAILISITGEDGITRTMTADEAWEIFRSQAITLPRLRNAWNTAVQQVEAVGE